MQEKIIETKTCKYCNASFDITDKDLEFYEKISPVFQSSGIPVKTGIYSIDSQILPKEGHNPLFKDLWDGKVTYLIPPPTLCPDCRQQRRLSFRNERKLYKRKCDATGKDIISIYSPDKPYKIYEQNYWWSDKWNALDYGKSFDLSKSFFEQFEELMKKVPLISLWNIQPENSDYNNNCFGLKDSYMNFNSDFGDNIFYSYISEKCNNIYDCSYIYDSENCYESFDIKNSYKIFFSNSLYNCSDCFFSSDLVNCKYCYGSSSLRDVNYFWFGEQKTKEEWEKLFFKNHKQSNLENYIKLSKKSYLHKPKKNLNILNSENCLGDYISDSKNLKDCFDVSSSENSKFVTYGPFGIKNVYDSNALGDVELGYECNEGGIGINGCCFIKNSVEGLLKSFYTILCGKGSSNLFGCIGLRNKSYCILNKQYTKEEYGELVPKIMEHMIKTGEWGEFFPSSISPFGYNETVAHEYFPMSREFVIVRNEAIQKTGISEKTGLLHTSEGQNSEIQGRSLPPQEGQTFLKGPTFNWSDYEAPLLKVDKIIPASKLPEDITKIPDEILNWAIECEVTKKPFRMIKQELEFYRKHNLSIPKRHPDQRHLDRMSLRNPRKLFDRKCDKCRKDIKTTYSAERKEIIYCEECYNKEIY